MIEGISKFIEYKRKVEKERPILTVNHKLITIDGIDGSGKSVIASAVVKKIKEKFGADAAILVSPSKFTESEGQERLFGLIKKGRLSEEEVNKGVVASFNRAYKDIVIPALGEGKIVVIDRSEVDLLRYGAESGDKELLEQRQKYISDGTLTHRFWAGNRIFIKASCDDVRNNLSLEQRKLSDHDMASLNDVEKREKAQKKAEEMVVSIPHQGEVNIIRKENKRVDDPQTRDQYIDQLADEIVNELIISAKR